MDRAKYATVLRCRTGKIYGQKRSKRSLISLPFFRHDFSTRIFFGHEEHLDSFFCVFFLLSHTSNGMRQLNRYDHTQFQKPEAKRLENEIIVE